MRAEKPLDGVSLKPLLVGDVEDWPDRTIFHFWRRRASLRTQEYRLDKEGRLFHLPSDPGQDRDVAEEHPELAARLKAELEEWVRKAEEELGPKDDRPFTAGYAPLTWLPARDGVPHGNIKRSNRFPNSSYFLNWTSTDDSITWDIEVAHAGDYTATVYYTCPAADVGATIELSFRDSAVRAKITEAHDPPLIGAEHDRFPRWESYTKDFKPLELGTIRLEAGRGLLTLRAVEIPGGQAAEVQGVALRRSD